MNGNDGGDSSFEAGSLWLAPWTFFVVAPAPDAPLPGEENMKYRKPIVSSAARAAVMGLVFLSALGVGIVATKPRLAVVTGQESVSVRSHKFMRAPSLKHRRCK